MQAQAQTQFRQSPSDIGKLYVRGSNDTMVPVSALTTVELPQRADRGAALQRIHLGAIHRAAEARAQLGRAAQASG